MGVAVAFAARHRLPYWALDGRMGSRFYARCMRVNIGYKTAAYPGNWLSICLGCWMLDVRRVWRELVPEKLRASLQKWMCKTLVRIMRSAEKVSGKPRSQFIPTSSRSSSEPTILFSFRAAQGVI